MHTRWLATAAEMTLAVLVVVGLLASGSAFPALGVFLSVLSPVPFVLLRLRHGFHAMIAALGVTALAVAGLSSLGEAAVFLLMFGFPALLLAEGLRRGSRPESLVTALAALLTLGGMGVLVLASNAWTHPLRAIGQYGDVLLGQMEALSARLGVPGDGSGSPAGSTLLPGFLRVMFRVAFPALFFAGSLLTAAGHVVLLRALMRRWPAQFGESNPEAFRWQLPEFLVWVFIGAGSLYLTGVARLQAVGLNVLIVLIALYFLQGLSIGVSLFQRFRLPKFLVAVSVLLLLFQPLFPLLVAGVGLFDVWFGFRRLSLPKTPGRT
jgi:uncharacterized protein YybS (DUF2232 family)